MPTPFYHLRIAEDLLEHKEIHPQARQTLAQNACLFLFGNTAPDVQTISGASREDTHFFSLPIQTGIRPPWELILSEHPALGRAVTACQAAFIAGYLCHLQADWLWVRDIFAPVFGPTSPWATFRERLYLHNVLRAYLDQQVLETLPPGLDLCLAGLLPDSWLPFVDDRHLFIWRDWLADQLQPGAASQTVEVFAGRHGLSPEKFYGLLRSEAAMEDMIFRRISRDQLELYRQNLLAENAVLLNQYFGSAPLRYQRGSISASAPDC